ncbi:MAG: hypothetical protein E3J29_01700 [Dehalococcoidia bacterium]|nr:MAG: hypothetical protein E3J29_01700 [Dehalococcoidia bacterium]
MGNDLFTERLRRFKQNERPEAVLVVADDPECTKIVVAWTSLDVRPVDKQKRPPGESEREIWDWLWANARYSLEDLAERSDLTARLVERKLKSLIGNRVLYPDGTVNSFVQRYLRERVLRLFDAKPRKPAKGT